MKYTNERNIQIIIELLKAHKIKKVIASPGTTHISFLGSIQNDPYFELYSSIDERSAAYMACGLAATSGEPVAITCTGATASRNYISGATEAYYRKLPIVAITGTQHMGKVGQNAAQVIDRGQQQKDTFKYIANVPVVHTSEDEEMCAVRVNQALLELTHHGGGPVLINFESVYSNDFSIKTIPAVHVIDRISYKDDFPSLKSQNVAIFVGAHLKWDEHLTKAVDCFCEKYNGVVICDQTSNYTGKYGISGAIVCAQKSYAAPCINVDLLIDLGDVSGAYFELKPKNVWRLSPDGEIRERGYKIRYVFEMEELYFFNTYNELSSKNNTEYYTLWKKEEEDIRSRVSDLPFSNVWIAQNCYRLIPNGSVIHLGILNTLRCWNLVPILRNNLVFSNTGGFGIDGNVSATIGSSLANKDKLHFLFVGDLAFFYDMNSIGNRCVGNNIRIMLINNGRGTEFRNFNHRAQKTFKDDADPFMAAGGHFHAQSKSLVKHYAEDLGFQYLSASNEEEFKENVKEFFDSSEKEKPILFEVFTYYKDESDALEIIYNVKKEGVAATKQNIKKIIGENNIKKIKKIIGK